MLLNRHPVVLVIPANHHILCDCRSYLIRGVPVEQLRLIAVFDVVKTGWLVVGPDAHLATRNTDHQPNQQGRAPHNKQPKQAAERDCRPESRCTRDFATLDKARQ